MEATAPAGLVTIWLDGRVITGFSPLVLAVPCVGVLMLAGLLAAVFLWAKRGGRRRVLITTGCTVICFVLLGAFIAYRTVTDRRKVSGWKAGLSRLGYPVELPSLPGYYPMSAITGLNGTSLEIDLGHGDPSAPVRTSVLSVSFYQGPGSEGASVLSECAQRPASEFICQSRGAGLWRVTTPGSSFDEIFARQRNLIVMAKAEDRTHIADSVLIRALTSLHPATAAEIAALPVMHVGS